MIRNKLRAAAVEVAKELEGEKRWDRQEGEQP